MPSKLHYFVRMHLHTVRMMCVLISSYSFESFEITGINTMGASMGACLYC
jgi:hypothetical protein